MSIYEEVQAEIDRAKEHVVPEGFDETNSQEDWIAYICAYAGRGSQRVFRNKRENCEFRAMMIKVAALAVTAVESTDAGDC